MTSAPATTSLPYGTWPSPLSAADLSGATVRLGELAVAGADTYWTEGRAAEGGRSVLLRRDAAGLVHPVAPASMPDGSSFDVRTRVHEYGGASFAVGDSFVVASRKEDDRLWLLDLGGREPRPLTPADGARYGDLEIDAVRGVVLSVCEDHGEQGFRTDPTTTLVAVPLDGSAAQDRSAVRVVASGTDFVTSPRLSSDGALLAYVTWDHPDMPWDASVVRVVALDADGAPVGPVLAVAGGAGVSAQEPTWTPGGDLVHVDDGTGWWNVHRTELGREPDGTITVRTRHLHPAETEFSAPQWVLGPRTLAVLDDEHLVVSWHERGRTRLGTMRLVNGELEAWEGDWEPAGTLVAAPGRVAMIGEHPALPGAVVEIDLVAGTTTVLARSSDLEPDPGSVAVAEQVSWTSDDGAQAHGFYYAPTLAGVVGPQDQRPPLVVMLHGGPTSATSAGYSLKVQYWTTRGFAVLDVDHGGSTGYGRAYRERLDGAWGVVDVADCASGARAMAQAGRADGDRLAIRGGSAGGFTTLAALAFTDTFAAGTSLYGIGDLAALAADTHKFEARYLDRLVGPYPEAAAVYAERSPLRHVEQITAPVLLLQGSEDRVVPPEQSRRMAAALRERGVPVAYVELEGEGHGFRGADAIRRSLETELAFYGRAFGFDPAGDVPTVELTTA